MVPNGVRHVKGYVRSLAGLEGEGMISDGTEMRAEVGLRIWLARTLEDVAKNISGYEYEQRRAENMDGWTDGRTASLWRLRRSRSRRGVSLGSWACAGVPR